MNNIYFHEPFGPKMSYYILIIMIDEKNYFHLKSVTTLLYINHSKPTLNTNRI